MQAVILGAGASGVLHALALRAAGVRVAAIFDPDAERARALADACGAKTVDSLASAASVDAAIAAVCGPPSVHVAQAEVLAAAGAGRIVLVEKPVATTLAELERIRALPSCVPVLQWRAGRALRALRRAVSHGELGAAPVASCDLAWARDDGYFAVRRGWGCGALLSIGIHAIDAVAWALGRDVDGAAGLTSSRRARGGEVDPEGETAAVGVLRLAGGAMASLRVSLDGAGDATRIVMCGAGKTVTLAGGEADPTSGSLLWSARTAGERARLEALERDTPGALGSPLLVPFLGAAVAAVRDGEAPGESQRLPSISDTFGAHAAAMCVAAPAPRRGAVPGEPARAAAR
ncbi:MAG: Gfo/Idh/MocA family oxidoreductase [Labilithrix sp.]|nr:Gfo/Idh/MocA family oxidoreductase [Labilithrix sp.]